MWGRRESSAYPDTLKGVIKSFRHRGLKRLFEREDRSLIRPDLIDTVENILFVLDEALSVQALAIPRYRLHPLASLLVLAAQRTLCVIRRS